ncbi:PREDICTED: Fanconi anemia-associated protein of 20 kDa-like [Galeopterus variegatus]|uniref:Fanconi anemia-associated protein of 20 kDa-like n=1 Tax=Galeopterus variegatus TaxID=482537 RepID=A0ABM0RYL4_GALVR|nr:PREDICTED: Fanconi anemia-associated protein of 20 kDa-like [Galeopterus variegatus]
MQAARGPRPRLSRRRPPSGPGGAGAAAEAEPPEAALGAGSPGASRPWFLQEGGECEHPWAGLLRLVGADLTLDDEPLPAFPGQASDMGNSPSPILRPVGEPLTSLGHPAVSPTISLNLWLMKLTSWHLLRVIAQG